MKKEEINIQVAALKPNPNNPRLIKDHKFNKLVKSLKEFPDMLKIRPIVVNKDFVILGGNMRYQAAIEAGLKDVWITKVDLTEEQEKEFIIKDNIGFGEWDWDLISNDYDWDNKKLSEWGLDIWQPTTAEELEDFFENNIEEEEEEDGMKKLVLEFTEQEYEMVKSKIGIDGRSAETILRTALDI